MGFLARVISGLWAGFWIFFAVASSAADFDSRGGGSLGGLLVPAGFTVVLLLLALTAWRWVKIGRIALPAAGLALMVIYPLVTGHLPVSTRVFVMATLGLPPISAGVLLIAAWRTGRHHGTGQTKGN
jgi:hypothetical protein